MHRTETKCVTDKDLLTILYNGMPAIEVNFFKSMSKTIKTNRASIAGADVVDEEACTHYTGCHTSNSCGEKLATSSLGNGCSEGGCQAFQTDIENYLMFVYLILHSMKE